MSDRIALARAIAARTKPRFIEIPRERGGGKVPFTEEQLTEIRGGLTAEEYRALHHPHVWEVTFEATGHVIPQN